jgi:beta-phosphoglucomutase family hydrolase
VNERTAGDGVTIRAGEYDAVVFDMDGVVTRTASVHAAAWKELFDAYLQQVGERTGTPYGPFTEEDYLRFVDGKPREAGVSDFLASRGIQIPRGDPSDASDADTAFGLGQRKNAYFLKALHEHGVQVYQSTVALIRRLHQAGIRTAIISASRNTTTVLEAAGVRGLFEAQIDGQVAAQLGLAGKPAPDVFLEAARRLGAAPRRAVVVEDAIAGVQAGHAGGFGLVIGVDRGGNAEALRAKGADVVVEDLSQVDVAARP